MNNNTTNITNNTNKDMTMMKIFNDSANPEKTVLYENTVIPIIENFGKEKMTLQYFKHFFKKDAETYINLFGEDVVSQVISNYRIEDFLTYEKYEATYALVVAKRNQFPLKSGMITLEIERHKGEWSKKEKVSGYEIWVCNYFSGNVFSRITKDCLMIKAPYLEEFKFNAYSLQSGYTTSSYDFYVDIPVEEEENDKKSVPLYVPINCLLNNDWDGIVKRHVGYNSNYYRGREDKYKNTIYANNLPEAIRLRETMEIYAKGEWVSKNNIPKKTLSPWKGKYQYGNFVLSMSINGKLQQTKTFTNFYEGVAKLQEMLTIEADSVHEINLEVDEYNFIATGETFSKNFEKVIIARIDRPKFKI